MRRDWSKIAHAADTLVFLMGVESLAENAQKLIENGRAADTPVALIEWGTWTRQKVVTGTLSDIAEVARIAGITAPAVTVVGDVVRYRDTLRWFDTGALFGKRVLVTRAREQASELSDKLRERGAEPLEFPTIRVEPPGDNYAALDAALPGISTFDWIVFTSANAVKHTFDRLRISGRDARALGAARVAAIGSATADALRERGIVADFAPTEFVSEAVLAQFPQAVAGNRILLPRAEEARDVLPDGLRERGATVVIVPAYRTVLETGAIANLQTYLHNSTLDVITFASGSSVRNFVEAVAVANVTAETMMQGVFIACIGPVTAETCRELIRAPDVIATQYTMDGLIAAIESGLAAKGAAA